MKVHGILLSFVLFLSVASRVLGHANDTALVEINGKWATENPLHHHADHVDITVPVDLAPETYLVGRQITFEVNEALRMGSGGNPLKFKWKFGDNPNWVEGAVVRHTFDRPGSYIVSLLYAQGDTSYYPSDTILVNVVPSANYQTPVAQISSRHEFVPGEPLTFSAAGSVGTIVSYEWDFGSSTTKEGKDISHIFPFDSAHHRTVFLRVTDKNNIASDAAVFLHAVEEPIKSSTTPWWDSIRAFFQNLFKK